MSDRSCVRKYVKIEEFGIDNKISADRIRGAGVFPRPDLGQANLAVPCRS
jgi:hypothetical protein